MMSDYTSKIEQALKDGIINKYMYDRLVNVAYDELGDISDELIQDARDASDAGVTDDGLYNIYFFLNLNMDDLLDDTFGVNIAPEEKKDLCMYILDGKNDDYKLDNLVDYRILTHKWLSDKFNKKAHPNISGVEQKERPNDLDKWITTLKNIYASIYAKKFGRMDAINFFTSGWDLDEKQKFINWMRYYEDGTTEKYNVKNAKFTNKTNKVADISIPESWVGPQDRSNSSPQLTTYKADETLTKREQEFQRAKLYRAKMRSRLRSLRALVEKFNDILPKQNLENIFDEIHKLEKSISKLEVYASIQDCAIRSAGRLRKFGFQEGADYLEKIAEEPVVGDDVIGALPVGESDLPDMPPGKPKLTIKTIIDRLEGLSKVLKSRDMIRELASIDILLNEMGMSSYFPELTDAQSKLIEAFGYASNKVESVVAKLRGSGATNTVEQQTVMPQLQQQPKPPPTPIKTEEVLEKPIGEVQTEIPKE
jgi:hypothetical protein